MSVHLFRSELVETNDKGPLQTTKLLGLAGEELTDLFGGGQFPKVDAEGNVTLTLGTQSFYWLKIGNARRLARATADDGGQI